MDKAFDARRDAAMSLLACNVGLTRRAGSFLGQCVVDPTPLTKAQADWLNTLMNRAGLSPLQDGGTE